MKPRDHEAGNDSERRISEAIAELSMPASAIRRLDDADAAAARAGIEVHWFGGRTPWTFDATVLAYDWYRPPGGDGSLHLHKVVPDPAAQVWFGGIEDGDCAVFVADAATAQRVLGETSFFEYFVTDVQLRWLLVENHHGAMIAVGDEVRARLRALAADEEER